MMEEIEAFMMDQFDTNHFLWFGPPQRISNTLSKP